MTRKLLVAVLLVAAVAGLAGWYDLLHLVAAALAALVLLVAGLVVAAVRRGRALDELAPDLDEEEAPARSALRDGLGGLMLGGVALALTALIHGHVLPPFYPLLVGDCPELLSRLAIYEETSGWPQAIALIDTRLSRPIDSACRDELVQRKCRYLIEWSKTLPLKEAEARLQEAEQWAEKHQLAEYRTMAQLMRQQIQPTPTPAAPVLVTPTPSPAPTPRPLPSGTTGELAGIDASFLPPTLFAYLRIEDGAGQPVTGLLASDVRAEVDGRPATDLSLSHYSQAPAPLYAALVIDYSGSMEGQPLDAAKAGARTLLSLLRTGDRVEVIGFNDRPQLLQAWTEDRKAAAEALDLLPAQNWTALWDALYLAAGDLSGCSGRKAIVVLTDGADNRSQHTPQEVIDRARRVGLSIFAIGLRSSEYAAAPLQALVQGVGGQYVEAAAPGELEGYYRKAIGAIQSEYRLTLTLDRQPDGGTHRLRVLVGGPQPLVLEQTYQEPAR